MTQPPYSESLPLLTVIVPVYNVAPYLRKCLDSICSQTYRNLEIICVNDGSTDKSPNILEEYAIKDPRIILIHQNNAGLSAARNAALQRAKGEYITGVDADDYLLRNCYKEAMKGFLEGECDMVIYAAKTEYADDEKQSGRSSDYSVKFSGYADVTDMTYRLIPITFWTKIFKKSIIDRYRLCFPEGKCYEDVAFCNMYLAVCKRVYGIPSPLCVHLLRKDSIMGKTRKGNLRNCDYLDVLNVLFSFFKKNDLWDKNIPCIEEVTRYATNQQYDYLRNKEEAQVMYKEWIRRWKLHRLFPEQKRIRQLAGLTFAENLQNILSSLFFSYRPGKMKVSFFGIPLISRTTKQGQTVYRLLGIKFG